MKLLQELLESIDEFDTKLGQKLLELFNEHFRQEIDEIYSHGDIEIDVTVKTEGPIIKVRVDVRGTDISDIRPKDNKSWHGMPLTGDTPVVGYETYECKQDVLRKALLEAQTFAIDNDEEEHDELLEYLTNVVFIEVFECDGFVVTEYLKEHNPKYVEI